MNHKKSMQIFLLSLCLLAASGAFIVAALQYRSYQKELQKLYGKQAQDTQAARITQAETETDDTSADAAASFAAQTPGVQDESSTHTQTQPVSGNTAEYRFELKIKDGYLDVYHFHTDNLFFHTGIPYSAITLTQRQELEQGKYFVNEQELYGYLESCTS